MTVITPPLYLNIDATYTADELGLPFRDLVAEGVVATGLAVSERGAGANMSVDVASGVAYVKGDESVLQPTYRAYNDATVNLAIAAADATNPRIDIVIAEVRDATFAGVSNDWRLRVVTGTPAGSPSAPATPNNSIKLADVSVPATDTTISNAQITDKRPRASLQADLGVPLVTALPTNPYEGQIADYQNAAMATAGIVWRFRYKAGGSYPWYFIGGPSYGVEDNGIATTTNTGYGDPNVSGSAGPAVTNPLAGDYELRIQARMVSDTANATVSASYSIGASAAVDADMIHQANAGTGVRLDIYESRVQQKAIAAAATVLTMKYKTSTGTATILGRRISIVPLRVA